MVNYVYTSLGQLRSVASKAGRVDYLVDGENRRVGRVIGGVFRSYFIYNPAGQLVAELNPDGSLKSRFVYLSQSHSPDYMISSGVRYFFIKDQVGSILGVLNADTGALAQSLSYDEFGKKVSDTFPNFQPFGYAGGIYESGTGFVRFGARDYDPETGRWTSKDPILFGGGDSNLYGYVANDPINFVDPSGLDRLRFDGVNLIHYDDAGGVLGTYPATSGRPGVTDPKAPNAGPIPAGNYTLNPSEISEGGFLRNLLGDWGAFRAPLHPQTGTNTFGRSGFFLHGGRTPGSAGCIDVGSGDKALFPNLINKGPIPLEVSY